MITSFLEFPLELTCSYLAVHNSTVDYEQVLPATFKMPGRVFFPVNGQLFCVWNSEVVGVNIDFWHSVAILQKSAVWVGQTYQGIQVWLMVDKVDCESSL